MFCIVQTVKFPFKISVSLNLNKAAVNLMIQIRAFTTLGRTIPY